MYFRNPVKTPAETIHAEDTEDGELSDCITIEAEDKFDDAIEDEEGKSDSKLNVNSIVDFFINLQKDFGKKFSNVSKKFRHGLEFSEKKTKDIKLNVDLDLDDTWLKHPVGNSSDSVGVWDIKELEFKHKFKWVPEAHHKEHPSRVPFNILDKEGAKFFEDKYLVTPHTKISLPTNIFSPNSVTIGDTNLHNFEYWSRQGILDAELTHNMLDLNQDILKGISQVLDELEIPTEDCEVMESVRDHIKNVINMNCLIMQSNFRSKSYAIMSNVKAKSGLRAMVLDKYEEDATISEMLKCTSFFTDSLFGPLPKHLTEFQPNCSGRKSLLKGKTPFTMKRKPQQGNTPNKRGRFDFNNSPRGRGYSNRGKGFADNFTNSYGNGANRNSNSGSKYATSPLFPKGYQNNFKTRGGKKGSKS